MSMLIGVSSPAPSTGVLKEARILPSGENPRPIWSEGPSSLACPFCAASLAAALASHPVWTPSTLAARDLAERCRDELADLMTRQDATHAVILSTTPLRIGLLTLLDGGASEIVEAQLALFGKLALIAAEAEA